MCGRNAEKDMIQFILGVHPVLHSIGDTEIGPLRI